MLKTPLKCPYCNAKLEIGFEYFDNYQKVIHFCKNCSKPIPVSVHPDCFPKESQSGNQHE